MLINAVIWLACSGASWRDLPERYGPWNSGYRRFRRWAQSGHWLAIFQGLQDPDLDWTMLDSTTVGAHQHAAGPKKVRLPMRPLDAAGVD
ncbi:transposase [Spirosoma oryzae]|uniref:transposase n=1 Tax=Spirosoma oryzae TaxID=1469603 RepID=UPI000D048EDC